MIYGDDKVREMARSILPSTSRHATRTRPMIHRAERQRSKAAVRAMLRDPELWDGGLDEPDRRQREISVMVRDRRSRDKLNHFEKWAVERTREMPVKLRLGHLAGLLPPGVIGEHALSHLENRRELVSEEQYRLRYAASRYRPKRAFLDRGEAAQRLRTLLELPDGQKSLNRALKDFVEYERSQRREVPLRVLLGAHDVLPFLRAVARCPHGLHLRRLVDAYLRRVKR